MEIERKFLINDIPFDLSKYPRNRIEQGYLSTEPVIRIRKNDDNFILTYKSKGFLVREEYNLPLTQESYEHLKPKADGIFIQKYRYRIPYLEKYTIELDLFLDDLAPLVLAEIEFDSVDEANSCILPDWFGLEVTYDANYSNSSLSKKKPI